MLIDTIGNLIICIHKHGCMHLFENTSHCLIRSISMDPISFTSEKIPNCWLDLSFAGTIAIKTNRLGLSHVVLFYLQL